MEKFDDESLTTYKYRQDFVNKYKLDYPEQKYYIIIKYSKILSNIKFKNCKYDLKTYNHLKHYL
jgi:hypothetical protein